MGAVCACAKDAVCAQKTLCVRKGHCVCAKDTVCAQRTLRATCGQRTRCAGWSEDTVCYVRSEDAVCYVRSHSKCISTSTWCEWRTLSRIWLASITLRPELSPPYSGAS
eukprot:7382446-Prymnesium_polylepis.2